MSSVALIGLGSMGEALATRLLTSHTPVLHIWNRTTTRPSVQALVSRGAKLHESASSAAISSEIVMICVLDYASIYDILQQLHPGALEGKTVVNLTNGTPGDARAMQVVMSESYGVRAYFDGAIMATPALVGTDAASVFYSGGGVAMPRAADLEDLLTLFGRLDYFGSDAGSAALYDLALLAAMYGMFGGTLTAIGLLSKSHLSMRSAGDSTGPITSIVADKVVPLLQALLPSLVQIATQAEAQDANDYGHSNTMQYMAIRNVVRACQETGVDGGSMEHLFSVFEKIEKEGGGQGGMGLVARKYFDSRA